VVVLIVDTRAGGDDPAAVPVDAYWMLALLTLLLAGGAAMRMRKRTR
jgi:hypothetical protein